VSISVPLSKCLVLRWQVLLDLFTALRDRKKWWQLSGVLAKFPGKIMQTVRERVRGSCDGGRKRVTSASWRLERGLERLPEKT
jgi:hypothetical protein